MKAGKARFSDFWPAFVSIVAFAFILALSSPRITAQEGQGSGYTIRRDVNLVVLPTAVFDKRGEFVTDLRPEHFEVFETASGRRVLQKVEIAEFEDVAVSVGLVIDNSGSMREKRAGVNAAAITFVEASNIEDEMFVVNFAGDAYRDQDFTPSIIKLKEALERVVSVGNTAVYDAIVGSMDYLTGPKDATRPRNARHDKKVLLLVTDGIDQGSDWTLPRTVTELQKKDVILYAIGIFSEEDKKGGEVSDARDALRELANATGGLALFPENNVVEIEKVCKRIAHDIRNQYTLGYYSSASPADETFRLVEVKVKDAKGKERKDLEVRTRTGYYPKPAPVKQ